MDAVRIVSDQPEVSEARFIFDHLPKTGGMALRAAFEQIFGPGDVSPVALGCTERWAEKNFSQYRMITGHFQSPVPFVGRGESRIRVTVLRDPIDRAVSEYYFFRNQVERQPWSKLAVYSKDHDFYAYLKILESEGDIAVSNRYAHHFAAQVSRGAWRESRFLALAKEAVAAYDLVGIQEQLQDFLDLFCARYRLPAVSELPRTNVTTSRKSLRDLDTNARDKLIRLNRVDLELYAFVQSRFQEQKRAIFRRFAAREDDQDRDRCDVPAAYKPVANQAAAKICTFGDRAVEILEAEVWGEASARGAIRSGETIIIRIGIDSYIDVGELTAGIEIVDDMGEVAFGTNTQMLGENLSVAGGRRYQVSFTVKADIRHGRYSITVGLHTGNTHADRCFHWREQAVFFDVVDGESGPMTGYCKLDARVGWEEVDQQRAGQKLSLR